MAGSIEPDEGEHLVDGWEPDVPDSDTLVRRAVAVHASWAVAVADSLGRPSRRTDRWAGGFVGERGALSNPVVLTCPIAAEEYAGVVDEVGEVVPGGVPFFLISPFPTPDLSGLGLVRIGHPPLMVRFPGGEAPPAKAGVELVEVHDEETLAVAERVLVDGYPMPELQPVVRGSILAPAILHGTTRVWLAHVDGEPAAVAAAHVAGGAVPAQGYVEAGNGRRLASIAPTVRGLVGLPSVDGAIDEPWLSAGVNTPWSSPTSRIASRGAGH